MFITSTTPFSASMGFVSPRQRQNRSICCTAVVSAGDSCDCTDIPARSADLACLNLVLLRTKPLIPRLLQHRSIPIAQNHNTQHNTGAELFQRLSNATKVPTQPHVQLSRGIMLDLPCLKRIGHFRAFSFSFSFPRPTVIG